MMKTPQIGLFFKWWLTGRGVRPDINDEGSALTGVEFVIVVIITLAILFLIYYLITKAIEKKSTKLRLVNSLSVVGKKILNEKFSYYNKLQNSDKTNFEKRVRYCLDSKMFTGEDGYYVTDEMKVLVSAAITQIGFGLAAVSNSNYTHILFIPDASVEPRSATSNSIVIPWKEFEEGFKNPEDGHNEGLKIIAITLLKDDQLQEKSYKMLSINKLKKWNEKALNESSNFMGGVYQNMQQDERLKNEYFGMAVVYFFELSIAFKQKYPLLYNALSDLLGQDPIKNTIKK